MRVNHAIGDLKEAFLIERAKLNGGFGLCFAVVGLSGAARRGAGFTRQLFTANQSKESHERIGDQREGLVIRFDRLVLCCQRLICLSLFFRNL